MRNRRQPTDFHQRRINISIEALVDSLIEDERENLLRINKGDVVQMIHYIDENYGGYDFITVNGPSYLSSKVRHYLSSDIKKYITEKNISAVLNRVNKDICSWLNSQRSLYRVA
jgi:hypothetical protein